MFGQVSRGQRQTLGKAPRRAAAAARDRRMVIAWALLACGVVVCVALLLVIQRPHGGGAARPLTARTVDPLRDLPSYDVDVIPGALNVPAPGGVSSPAAYASYLNGLCAAAAP